MLKEKVLVVGSGGHAKTIVNIIEVEGKHEIAGLIDDNKPAGTEVYGYPVLGGVDAIPELGISKGIIGIGDNWLRSVLAAKVEAACPGFEFITAVHPFSAVARGVILGPGTAVFQAGTIGADVVIGRHGVVFPITNVAHETKLGDYVNIHPGVCVGGGCSIGDFVSVAMGSTVIHGITIGEHTVIGAGSTVIKNIGSYVVAFGSPCKAVRERQAGEEYM